MIRPAQREDLSQLQEMGRAFFETSGLAQVTTYSLAAVARLWALCEERPDLVQMFVIDNGEGAVGAAAVMVCPPFYSDDLIAQEVFWYVEPEYRGTPDSMRLFQKLEQWAREKGAAVMTMAALAANGEVGALYERRGYTRMETNYFKRLA